jgi:fructosamine-3-kinase
MDEERQVPLWSVIAQHIVESTGRSFRAAPPRPVGGGCINKAYVLAGQGQRFFVKLNRAAQMPMFEAEAAGLEELRGAAVLRVPGPICWGVHTDSAYLVLEYLQMDRDNPGSAERLGRGLALLHGIGQRDFGWRMNNTIGSTPQLNKPMGDWVEFFRRRRLLFQLELAARNDLPRDLQAKGERLADRLDAFFRGYRPRPSLLHGDLWSGNYAADEKGNPVVFDPAVYYGDREADLAMTELFGGFPARFYDAYREAWPLDEGYSTRKTLYNLYHILNHLNLFGKSYLGQVRRMLDQLLGEV